LLIRDSYDSGVSKNKRKIIMLRKIFLASAIAGVLSISAVAACDPGMGNGMGDAMNSGKKSSRHMGYADMHNKMMSLSTVKLSTEQKTKIDAINEEFRSEMAKLHIKDRSMMKDPFVVAGGFNKESFKKEKMEKMGKNIDMQAEHLAKIWAVLTPEQQKNIAALAK